ncbi:hypothetical protein [Cupriavidus basilensis]
MNDMGRGGAHFENGEVFPFEKKRSLLALTARTVVAAWMGCLVVLALKGGNDGLIISTGGQYDGPSVLWKTGVWDIFWAITILGLPFVVIWQIDKMCRVRAKRWSATGKAGTYLLLFLLAFVLSPTILGSRQESSTQARTMTVLSKRDPISVIRAPYFKRDGLGWLNQYDLTAVPNDVICVAWEYEASLFFDSWRTSAASERLARQSRDLERRPPAELVRREAKQCRIDADNVVKNGLVRESALLASDFDRFLRMSFEEGRPNREIIVRRDRLPEHFRKVLDAYTARPEVAKEISGWRGVITPALLARALGRDADARRLESWDGGGLVFSH